MFSFFILYYIKMDKKLTPVFGRVGSKRSLKNKISRLFPKDYDRYVEPFIGGGAVFLNTPLVGHTSAINDKDRELIKYWKMLKRGVGGNKEYYNSGNLQQLQSWYNSTPKTDIGRLTKFILKTSNTFGSKGWGKLYKESNPYAKLKKIDDFKDKLKNTTITSGDYKAVMRRYNNSKTFFYLDPPYSVAGKSKGDNASSSVYKESEFNVEGLVSFLKTIKGKWLLSLEDSAKVRRLFKGNKIRGLTTGGTGNLNVGAKKRKEV